MNKCICGKEIVIRQRKYCSKDCFYKYRIRPSGLSYNLKKINPSWFSDGHKPWNDQLKGIHLSVGSEFKKGEHLQEDHPRWKGNQVGYKNLHKWVKEYKGSPTICSNCGIDKRVQWANKSHEYKRDLEDWLELCQKCHRQYDKGYLGIAKEKYGKNYEH